MRRREFIIRTGKALALTGISVGTGIFFHNRVTWDRPVTLAAPSSFEVPSDVSLPRLVLARNEDHRQALLSALEAIGGINRFVQPGETVTIKPNIGWDRAPEQAANTNPVLVGEMARLCVEAGASQVIVTDVSCNDARRCFIRSGIRDAVINAGAEVALPDEKDFVQANLGGKVLTDWPVLKHFVRTDRLINMPIVKQHSLSDCTIAMKNLYGILGGRRHKLHQSIDQSIVDLAAFCRPTLTVVDATRVLVRGGPQGGSLDDVEVHNTVICATDQVAADSRAVEYLGLTGGDIGHIVLAEKAGLGLVNYNEAGYVELDG